MRLRRLDLTRYGKFTDHVIDFGEKVDGGPDLHIVYGLNEAGKSTALSGFLDLLFGIEERSRYDFLHPYAAMEVGAVLEVGEARHELRRVKQRTGSLRDAAGQPVGDGVIAGALAGLTRDAYRMMFSLDDQTLEEGGNAILDSKGDLGELLFSASAGLAGLSRALSAVTGEADAIFRRRASSTEIAGLKRRLNDLKAEREKVDVQASAHAALVAELRRAEQAYDAAMTEHGTLKARRDDLGGLVRAAPLAAEHASLSAVLAPHAELPRPPAHWASDLPALMVADATLGTKRAAADERLERLRAEIDGIAVDRRVLGLADRIEALSLGSARVQTAEPDLPKRRAELAESRSRLAQLARAIAGPENDADPDALAVDAATLGSLRGLIERWSGVEEKLSRSREEHETASEAFDRAREDRAALDRDHPALGAPQRAALQAAAGRVRETDLLARRRLAQAAARAKSQAAEEAMRRLAPWSGEPAALEALRVPSARQIQAWRDEAAEHALRSKGHCERGRGLETEGAALAAKVAAAEAAIGPIGDAESGRLRARRDAAWVRHRDAMDAASAAAFEQAMQAVDGMAEARLAAADRLAELRGLRRDLEVCRAGIAREAELLSELDGERSDLSSRIEAAGLPGSGDAASAGERLSGIEDWLALRERAVAAIAERRTAEAECAAVEAEIAREADALGEALAAAGTPPEGLDLPALLQAADTLLAEDARYAEARAAADKRLRDDARSLEARRKDAAAAAGDGRAWEEAWGRALAGTWFAGLAADRAAVRAIVEAIAGLPERLAERDGLSHRVEAMQADREAFLAELASVQAALGEPADGTEPVAAASALRDRLRAAGHALDARRAKEAERADLEAKRRVLLEEIGLHDARKAERLAFFGLTSLADVSARLDECARRDRIEADRDKLAARIRQEAGAPSLEAALERLAEGAPEERTQAYETSDRRVEDLNERLKELFAAKSAAADRLAAVGGDDAVVRIEAERRTILLEIEDKALRFLHLRTGALLAERALQAYREKHRGSMMGRASDAFRAMTRDAYAGLATRPEKDREILIGRPSAGGSKLATDMSKGTRFQLYLALRLAGYEEFVATRHPVPFVADDIMETFDEPRSEEVLSLFGKVSHLGQVIYLTHHRHLCDLARKAVPGARVHELP